MASNGIGRLLKLCLDSLETEKPMEKAQNKRGEMVWPWAHELHTPAANAGHTPPGLPKKPGQIGSSNFGVVANVCELTVATARFGAGHGAGLRPAGWLSDFYRRQGPDGDLGHMLLEPLSTTYGEAHIVSALIAYALGIKEVGPFLERELALCLRHRCPKGTIVSASTRAGKTWKQGHREEFTDFALRGGRPRQRHQPHMGGKGPHHDPPGKERSLIARAFTLPNGWQAPAWMKAVEITDRDASLDRLKVADARFGKALGSIRFASGPLVVTHHENGHVSRWETGPVCYASPLVAVAVSYQPFNVRHVLYPGKTAAPFGELRTVVTVPTGELMLCRVYRAGDEAATILTDLDIHDLGPVVAEHRFPMVGLESLGGLPSTALRR